MKKFKIRFGKRRLIITFGAEWEPRHKHTYRVWVTTSKGYNHFDFKDYLLAKHWVEKRINPRVYPDEKYTIEEVRTIETNEEV